MAETYDFPQAMGQEDFRAALPGYVSWLNGSGLAPSQVKTFVLKANATKCQPPLPPAETLELAGLNVSSAPSGATPAAPHDRKKRELARPKLITEFTGANRPPETPDLIAGLLKLHGKLLIAGPPKANKSMSAINLALSCATGRPWLGFPCRKVPALYVNAELAEGYFQNRVADVAEAMGIDPAGVGADFSELSTREPYWHHSLDTLAGVTDCLGGWYAEHEPGLLVLDPLYKLLGGVNENDNGEVGRFLDGLDDLRAMGCTVVLLHHHSKGGSSRGLQDRFSGAGALARDYDALVDLTPLEVPEGSPEWDALAATGVENPASGAVRLEFDTRAHATPRPFNCVRRFPLVERDTEGVLDGLSPRGRSAGARATSERFTDERARKQQAVTYAVLACRADGVPATRRNAYDRIRVPCQEAKLAVPEYATFKRWTSASGPTSWRVGDGNVLSDTAA